MLLTLFKSVRKISIVSNLELLAGFAVRLKVEKPSILKFEVPNFGLLSFIRNPVDGQVRS